MQRALFVVHGLCFSTLLEEVYFIYRGQLFFLVLQSRFGGKPLKIDAVCFYIGTAVLKRVQDFTLEEFRNVVLSFRGGHCVEFVSDSLLASRV